MNSPDLVLFVGLFIKHFFADFPLQTLSMVQQKGTYGNLEGLKHAAIHASLTFLVFCIWGPLLALGLALLDGVIHYHIDFAKARFGTRDTQSPLFWNQFGADQLAHSLTYVMLVFLFGLQE